MIEEFAMNTHVRKSHLGVTLIELLVALSVLAILLAFASPALRNTGARADIKQATDQVAQAFRTAKNTARINNSNVTLTLTTNGSANTISLVIVNCSVADEAANRCQQPLPVQLPNQVSVTAATSVFTYNPLGMIDATGTIALASTVNSDFASSVAVNTLMGHVTASYNSM